MKTIFLLLLQLSLFASSPLNNNATKCSTSVRKMEVLPGRGWDSIRNKDMGQVLELTYDTCLITEDGLYLIPDDVHVTAIKAGDLELSSELIEHWLNYSSVTAQSFKANAGWNLFGAISVQGSFDSEYQYAKEHQVRDRSMTTRVQLRTRQYVVQSSVNHNIHPDLMAVLMKALTEIENMNNEKAQYIIEMVIRDYGTHYITQAEAGAMLNEEDYVGSAFVQDHWSMKSEIRGAAGFNFLDKWNFGAKFKQSVDKEFYEQFLKNITSTKMKSLGGEILQPNLTVNQWAQSVPNNLVMVDRSGNPLSFLITQEHFPKHSNIDLNNLRIKIDEAITDYYTYNTHRGCTKVDSRNFDFTANVDDGSCKTQRNNFTFGGLFVDCKSITTNAGDMCVDLRQTNPMTGQLSCSSPYSQVPLLSGIATKQVASRTCHDVCSGWWLWKKCHEECEDVYLKSEASYTGYWCAAYQGPVSNNTGYMFGGLYTSWLNNPMTQTKSCPLAYITLNFGPNLKVCVSNDYELGLTSSVRFGGFFSCNNGNPLVGRNTLSSKSNDQQFIKGCPHGYSQHIAVIDYGCEINYCVEANAFGTKGHVEVVLPPFRDRSALFTNTSPLGKIVPSVQEESMSTGTITVIAVMSVVVIIIALLAFVFYRRRRQNRRSPPSPINGEHEPLLGETSGGDANA